MRRSLKYIAMVAVALFVMAGEAAAQHNVYKGRIEFGTPQMTRQDDELIIDVDVDMTNLKIHRQQLVMLTPMLRMADNSHNYIFAPVAINGKTRYDALQRAIKFNNIYFEYEPETIVLRTNGRNQILPLSLSVPFEPWMAQAELVFVEEVTGCANCHVAYNEYVMSASPMVTEAPRPTAAAPQPKPTPTPTPAPVQTTPAPRPVAAAGAPNFVLSLIVPEVEETKLRSETYSSSLNFVVGRYDIIRDYKNNRERLDMVDRLISNVRLDRNVKLTELKVTGYASPEGYMDWNLNLSKKRALAFVDYLKNAHGLPEYMVQFYWRGEDWQGLRQKVAESEMPEKREVLYVIDNYSNIGQRKAMLRNINYGGTYEYLLGVYFPQLRRDEYTISYIARNFDPTEARRIIKTKPQQLSLNEMFLVASSYKVGSPEFKEVFAIAARYFPADATANTNAGAIDIENGNTDAAIRRLTGIDTPEAWNNLGVAYVKKGEYALAEQLFRKASSAGNKTAANNLQQLQGWMMVR